MTGRRWLWALLVVPLIAGLAKLRFDTDVLNLLPAEVPSVAGLKLYQSHFANHQELIITVANDDSAIAEEAAQRISAALRAETNLVSDAVWQAPWLEKPDQTAEFLAWLWLSRPTGEVQALQQRLENPAATLAAARDRLATSVSPLDLARLGHDPFGLAAMGPMTQGPDWFASSDGTFRMIYAQPKTAPGSLEAWARWLEQAHGVANRAAQGMARVGFTGSPVFTVETAAGMKSDMRQSIGSTILMVAALFWWAHRRFRPLLWMLAMLVMSLFITMALGGLIFGSLNVVSFGFAAILLGLGVDYALVLYQELLGAPDATAAEVRREAAGGIWWSAGTTALAFALLNFAGLPGLGQLGTLVAIGIMVAATAMLYGFLPGMTRAKSPIRAKTAPENPVDPGASHRIPWAATIVALVVGAAILSAAWPGVDRSAQPLGSFQSQAAAAAAEIDRRMNQGAETLWLLVQGRDETEVLERLEALERSQSAAKLELPTSIWPRPERQQANRERLQRLAERLPGIKAAAAEAGFTEEALGLTESMLRAWRTNSGTWPEQGVGRWLVNRVSAKTGDGLVALGLLRLKAAEPVPAISTPGVLVAGWSRLAEDLLQHVERRLRYLTVGMSVLLVICLRLAFGRWVEVWLSFAALGFGFMLTLLVMAIFGIKWNLLSLTAIPLLLGAAVDYTIHVQRALNRYEDDARKMRRTIGRALMLVTGAAVAGFGSLSMASNAGLASFEILCAAGMICIFLTSLYLLPAWHYTFARKKRG